MITRLYKKVRHGAPAFLWRVLQSRAKRALQKNKELWEMLDAYLSKTGSTGCSYTDYLELYTYVRTHKPKEVLECGTGVSTIILGHALWENAKESGDAVRLTSMEELPEFFNRAKEILPEHLTAIVDLRLSETVPDAFAFVRGMRYKDTPERSYDFVFIDGPNPKVPTDGTMSFDFDFIRVVLRSDKPVYAIVDRRITTCYALQSLFGRDKVRFDYVRELGFIGPCRKEDLENERRMSARLAAPHPFRRQMFFDSFPF